MCLPLVGAVVSGVGAAIGLAGQKAGHKADAAMQRRQAELERASGNYEAARTTDQVKRALGTTRAGLAANGLDISGAEAVTEDIAREGALDVAAIRWNSSLRQDNAKYKAAVSDMNARITGAAMGPAFLTPIISGAAQYAPSFGS